MKKPVLVLFALLALVPFAQSLAQGPPAVPAANPVASPAPDSVAQFLASLVEGQTPTLGDRTPAPSFMTGCAGNSSLCARGEICCYLCGNPPEGDDSGCWGCVTPVKGGGCPQVY